MNFFAPLTPPVKVDPFILLKNFKPTFTQPFVPQMPPGYPVPAAPVVPVNCSPSLVNPIRVIKEEVERSVAPFDLPINICDGTDMITGKIHIEPVVVRVSAEIERRPITDDDEYQNVVQDIYDMEEDQELMYNAECQCDDRYEKVEEAVDSALNELQRAASITGHELDTEYAKQFKADILNTLFK